VLKNGRTNKPSMN